MSPDRWSTIKALFEEALQRPVGERASWLDAACKGDTDLQEEVERLIEADTSAVQFFDTLGNKLHNAAGSGDRDLPHPDSVGPWRIIAEAGRGGMGRVFEAVRDDGLFDQRVAIKVVDSHSPQLVARFEQERRILAGLEHPNICRLLDGGELEDGRPYLVMEFVEGEPITAYADRNRPSVDERLTLFSQVCDAVAFAHRHLVIHRDLKPSNVLVTEMGKVKLLDFGIAKLLDENGEAKDGSTRTGRRLLTPHFAAPEQILNEPITTATDVYTLGILLYVLLTGCRPFGATGGSQHEIEQEILEKEPTAPSVMLSKETGSAGVEVNQGVAPLKWSRRLRGDVDNIVLKALRKEPERRYASVEAFQRDIQRHLDGFPVEARPATLAYRFCSFVKRHKTGVVVTIVGLLLAAALVTISVARITAERDRARFVSDFLSDILSRADDPDSDTAALLSLLNPAITKAEEELASEPAAQSDVFHVGGRLYFRAGRADIARSLFHQALAIRRELHPDGHEDVAASLFSLGEAHIGADSDSSVFYFEEATNHYWSLSDDENSELAWGLLQWARMLPLDHPEKESMFDEAMAMMRRVHGERSTNVADALHEYYVHGFGGGTNEDIQAAFEESIAIYAENEMEDHPYAIHAMHNLGLVLDGQGEVDRALDLLRRSVELGKASIERGSSVLFTMEINLGATLHERGMFSEADEILQDVASETLRYLPDSSVGIGNSHYWYGRNLNALGKAEDAEAALRMAWEIQVYHNSTSPRTFRTQAELALALSRLGRRPEAERLIKDAADGLRDHPFSERRALEQAISILEGGPGFEAYHRRLSELGES